MLLKVICLFIHMYTVDGRLGQFMKSLLQAVYNVTLIKDIQPNVLSAAQVIIFLDSSQSLYL